jgi:hypothetical protein
VAVIRNDKGQFAVGWHGGPGRPPGKRNYLSEVVLAALADDFASHGAATIEEVRKTKPAVYLQCCTSLLPKQVQVERSSPFADLTDAELNQLEELLTAIRARTVHELEQHNGAAVTQPIPSSEDSDEKPA